VAHVLIAGANDGDLHTYRALFSNHKYTVDTAKRAHECVAKLARSAPDALILDFDIPGGGADGVVALMRADAQLRRIPVLLTASAATRSELACLVSPPVLLALTKPISLAVLLQTVDDATTILRQTPWSETGE
jgi:CheY-like chemotaxis protein